MRERGVEVLELHDMLAETVADPAARAWLLDRRITPNDVGPWHDAASCAPWLDEMPAAKLAEHLIGGIAILDLPQQRTVRDARRCVRRHRLHHSAGAEHAVSARSLLLDLQRRHVQSDVLAGAQARDAAAARGLQVPSALQGRRLHDLVGRLRRVVRWRHASRAATSCRSARASCSSAWASARRGRPSSRWPQQLFKHQAATRVIACLMPKSRAAMHLDTVFTLLRSGSVHGVPRGRGSDPLLQRAARTATAASKSAPDQGHLFDVVRRRSG